MQLRPLLDRFDTVASWLQSPLLLIIRGYWGFSFAQDGWRKLHHLDKITEYFGSLGIPYPQANAIFASVVQLVFGSLLMIGLLSRVSALPLIGTMLVAYATAEKDALHALFAGDPDKFTDATPFLFLLASVIVLAFGPGKISLDGLIFRRKSGN
ncbi:MAG TPA: DoxX family protein [Candidatus Didemnitutus sp.]|nr:DoxX family protein [Candidatus Didemnitutus sp.]